MDEKLEISDSSPLVCVGGFSDQQSRLFCSAFIFFNKISMCIRSSTLHTQNHIQMQAMHRIWPQIHRHKYTSSVHFLCIYNTVGSLRPCWGQQSDEDWDWSGFLAQQREPDLWCDRESSKALQLLLYSTSAALMTYRNFIPTTFIFQRVMGNGKSIAQEATSRKQTFLL